MSRTSDECPIKCSSSLTRSSLRCLVLSWMSDSAVLIVEWRFPVERNLHDKAEPSQRLTQLRRLAAVRAGRGHVMDTKEGFHPPSFIVRGYQWNVRALPPIPHFETPVPSPALFYPEIETAHVRPLFRLFQVLSLKYMLLCFDYKMGLTLRFFVINGRYSKNVVRVPGECERQDRPAGCWQTREIIMRPAPFAFPGPAAIKTFRQGRGWRINQASATLCNVHFSSQLLEM